MWHHIWGIAGALSAVFVGYGLPGVAGMVLVVEISTIFLNYRSFYKKDEYHLLIPSVSQLLFFITYTVFRIFWLPYVLWKLYEMYTLIFHALGIVRKICYLIAALQFGLLLVLNYYWYIFILKGLFVMLGIIKKSGKTDKLIDKKKVDGPLEDNKN